MTDTLDAEAFAGQTGTKSVAVIAHSAVNAIIPTDFDQVWRMALAAHKAKSTSFKSPEEILVAMCHGMEVGMKPFQSTQRIAVINGRPSIWGDAVPGLALATGLVEDWDEGIRGEGDQMVAFCTVKRKGIRTAATRTFSVADAKMARLWGKAGPWQQYPKRMLQMRARVAFRDLFADALGGFYIAEELIGIEESAKDVTPAPTPPVAGVQKPLPPKAAAAYKEPHPDVIKAEMSADGQASTGPQVPLDGEVMPPRTENKTEARGRKPLPPAAAKAKPQPVTETTEEPVELRNRLIDEVNLCASKFVLAQWINAKFSDIQTLPKNYRDDVEQAIKFKEASLDKLPIPAKGR